MPILWWKQLVIHYLAFMKEQAKDQHKLGWSWSYSLGSRCSQLEQAHHVLAGAVDRMLGRVGLLETGVQELGSRCSQLEEEAHHVLAGEVDRMLGRVGLLEKGGQDTRHYCKQIHYRQPDIDAALQHLFEITAGLRIEEGCTDDKIHDLYRRVNYCNARIKALEAKLEGAAGQPSSGSSASPWQPEESPWQPLLED